MRAMTNRVRTHTHTMQRTVERRKTSRAQSERRRRKFLSDSQSDRTNRALRREQEALTNKLLRKPAAERDLEESLKIVARHTPMFLENREKREEQYRERRQLDAEAAIMRDNDYFYKMRMHYELEIQGQHSRYQEYVQATAAAGEMRVAYASGRECMRAPERCSARFERTDDEQCR